MYRKFPQEINAYLYENDSLLHKSFPKVPGTGNFFLWQEISSCDNSICGKKFLLVARNFFLWQEILPVARHLFFRKISDCDIIFAWKSCYSSQKKVLPLTQENVFLLQKSIGLAGTFCIIWQEIPSCQVCDKMRKFLPTFRVSLKISWEPGSLAPGEYPTLPPPTTRNFLKVSRHFRGLRWLHWG